MASARANVPPGTSRLFQEPRAKDVIGPRAGSSSGVTLVPPRRCASGPARSTAKEKGVAQPGLEWTLSTRAERLPRIKRWFGS
jgi:hypothetical protein